MKLQIFAERRPFNNDIALFIGSNAADGDISHIAKPLVFDAHQAGSHIAEPCVTLDQTSAQRLIDELWQCGLRPSEGTGSAGAMAATERHLQDLRKLVFKDKA